MNGRRFKPALASIAALSLVALTGCGADADLHAPAETQAHDEPAEHGEAHAHGHGDAHDDDRGAAQASFRAGEGLRLSEETAAAMEISTVSAEIQPLAPAFRVTASVFDAGPPARASALVPLAIAEDLKRLPPAETRVLAVRRGVASALTQAEVVLALPGSHRVGTTVPLTLRGVERAALVVPEAAVLRSATGTYVYRANGPAFLRTSVQTGASDDSFVEIVDGLSAGDRVVADRVESLWLTELRLTKGGGHSH